MSANSNASSVQVHIDQATARFWPNVDKTGVNGCWLWLGTRRKGYGRFQSIDGRRLSAHRVAYELLVGPIPVGLVLDHLCRNRACVNPDHLEAVTNRDNILRGYGASAQMARRTSCPKGHSDYIIVIRRGRPERQCRPCRIAINRRDRRRGPSSPPLAQHGTAKRYWQGCSCSQCRAAVAAYNQQRRAIRRGLRPPSQSNQRRAS